MSELVRRANYAASLPLKASGLNVGRSHLGEIHAALLGYATYAALTREALDPSAEIPLERAQVIVLDVQSGISRAQALLPGLPKDQVVNVVTHCASALGEVASPITVFYGTRELFEDWARDVISAIALEAEDLDPVLRRVVGAPKFNDGWEASGPLWSSRHGWVIEAQGTMQEEGEEGDELYPDVVVDWKGRLVFQKAGRAGLIVDTGGATCQTRR